MTKEMNNTCVRVLETLKYLSEGQVSISDIIKHFESNDPNKRVYSHVAILKYLNTLKVFGFKIDKVKDKYILKNFPFTINFSEDDLKGIIILKESLNSFPERKTKEELSKFFNDIEMRFDKNARTLYEDLQSNLHRDFSSDYGDFANKIRIYEKYCMDNQKLKITYKDVSNGETTLLCDPKEIKYDINKIYFIVYNPSYGTSLDILINDIIEVSQLPSIASNSILQMKVIYKLKGELAKRYRLRDNEQLQAKESCGDVLIINENEDKNLLLRRLLRYNSLCEVISPRFFREEMINTIDKMLANYE